MALNGVMTADIDNRSDARTRCWYGESWPCPKLVVLIRWCGSRSISRKKSGFDIFNVGRDIVA
jgi:hypothetical protein